MANTKEFARLFQPGTIGSLQLRNRIVMAPIGTNLADIHGTVTPRLIDWYVERAWGGVGLMIIEGASADLRYGRGRPQSLRMDSPKLIPGLNELVEAVQASGAKIAAQINVSAAGVDPELGPKIQPVGASAITHVFDEKSPGLDLMPRMKQVKRLRALKVREIKELRSSFMRGARIAKSAGFDAIEIHCAHGYLLSGFMSAYSNKRKDSYGGDLDGRLKFVFEVYQGIREEVGDDFPIIVRFSGQEYVKGGRKIKESCRIAKKLEKIGVNALDISAGISLKVESSTWLHPPMSFPQGAFIADAHAIKNAVQIPVIGVGKIRYPNYAEKLLQDDRVDYVALGRTLIADPNWPIKAAEGRHREIRQCLSCNRCMRIMARRTIRCAVNARAGLEREFPMVPARRKRRVAIVGGGPAGMEAARVSAIRGHKVTLFEKERFLGGQLKLAIVPPYKNDLSSILVYLKRQLKILGVEVNLKHKITSENIQKKLFDVVIIATGCEPPKRPLLNGSHKIAVRSWDVLSKKAKLSGKRIVILGNSRIVCEVAELLALRKEKLITIINPGPPEQFGIDLEPLIEWRLLVERLKDCGVKIMHGVEKTKITAKGLKILGSKPKLVLCDHVILDEMPISNQSYQNKHPEMMNKFIKIGDCVEPRNLYHAIHSGFHAAYRIN